ncbi:glycosyltransferase family 2 protein [uncultured Streptococcus sp.]|uniref:glycosyltransferase family 2 protein n=1 Tax=uncultured Streptococcus sp. TaxID=83427 RepID=UPI003211A4BE
MHQELISIIIPIFNTEKYLHQCLDSILSQSYGNFECLLINDGSTDASASICREYVAKDARFRYFEKENGGVSSARNLGIERSGGAYVTFIDSDDWVEFDYLEVLYSAIIQDSADISVSSYRTYEMSGNQWLFHAYKRVEHQKVFSRQELMNQLVFLDRLDASFRFVSCKLVRKSILAGIWFNESTHLGEDMEFWFKLYLIAEKVVFSNRDSYVYRRDLTDSKYATLKHIQSDVQHRLNFIAFLRARGMDTDIFVNQLLNRLYDMKTELELDQFEHREVIGYIEEVLLLLEVNINP